MRPTQLPTKGQWWSILRTQMLQTEQWWALGGFTSLHFAQNSNWKNSSTLFAFPLTFLRFVKYSSDRESAIALPSSSTWYLLTIGKLTVATGFFD